jgi:hypothetical protein
MAVIIYPDCNEIIAKEVPGVAAYVYTVAQSGGAKARSILNAHRDTGASYIEVTKGSHPDSHISLVDPGGNAIAIEFGRPGTTGRQPPSRGVHALQGAF